MVFIREGGLVQPCGGVGQEMAEVREAGGVEERGVGVGYETSGRMIV